MFSNYSNFKLDFRAPSSSFYFPFVPQHIFLSIPISLTRLLLRHILSFTTIEHIISYRSIHRYLFNYLSIKSSIHSFLEWWTPQLEPNPIQLNSQWLMALPTAWLCSQRMLPYHFILNLSSIQISININLFVYIISWYSAGALDSAKNTPMPSPLHMRTGEEVSLSNSFLYIQTFLFIFLFLSI